MPRLFSAILVTVVSCYKYTTFPIFRTASRHSPLTPRLNTSDVYTIIPLFNLAYIGEKEEFDLSKKTALRAIFAASND